MNRATLLVVIGVILAGCATTKPSPLVQTAVDCNSTSKEDQFQVLSDQASLEAFWQKTCTTQLPVVDFSKDMIVARLLGQRSTGGYSILLQGIQSGQPAQVNFEIHAPASGCSTLQVFTYPEKVAIVARISGPFVKHDVTTADNC
jgi:hypothetical protein